MLRNKKRFLVWLVLTVIFMTIIFLQSSMPYHSQDTKPILKKELQLIPNALPEIQFNYGGTTISSFDSYDFIDFIIRKMGHVTEYAILTMLWLKTFSYVELKLELRVAISAAFSLLYACSDEWHQTFVSERTGHLIDVLIPDLAGTLLVLLFFYITLQLKKMNKSTARIL